MEAAYHITSEDDHHRIIPFLEDRIYEHNSKKVNRDDGKLFSIVARSADKDIIGGIAGWTWANACEITQLWVDEAYREHGIGKVLLETAEKEARSNGCRRILVRSFGFQAPEFYKKHGFRSEHIIDAFPEGYQYHILIKELS
jgi:ribosomal protein S18 acetylase RimI-like enzyme